MKKNKKILIVDDDHGILEVVKLVLQTEGYDVDTCDTGKAVDVLTKQKNPDLILLDMLISGRDGRDICVQLKENDETKNIPVVMFSAHPSAELAVKKAGAEAFLPKPFSMSDLLTTVGRFLK